MKNAIEAVESKDKTMSAAAKMLNVPTITLDDRVNDRVKHGSKLGVSLHSFYVCSGKISGKLSFVHG